MPDFFTLGTRAVYISADPDAPRRVTNFGGSTIYYSTTSDTDSGDTAIASGSNATITAGQWFISAASSSIMVEALGKPSYASDLTTQDDVTVGDDIVVTGDAAVGGGLSVIGASTLIGAVTTTSGIAGGAATQIGTWQPVAATSGTDTACTNGTAYVGSIFVPKNVTLTGIQYLVGSVGGTDKVVASLHSAAGAVLANSATAGTTVGAGFEVQQVAFTGTYAAVGPLHYWVALTFNGTTAKFRSVPAHCQAGNGVLGNGVTQTFGTPATFTPPTTFTADKVPVASVY